MVYSGSNFVQQSNFYKRGYQQLMISGIVSLALIAVYFLLLLTGSSIQFQQINAFQVLLHGLGVLALIWMILDVWQQQWLTVIGALTVFVPLVMEIGIVIAAKEKFSIVSHIHAQMKAETTNS